MHKSNPIWIDRLFERDRMQILVKFDGWERGRFRWIRIWLDLLDENEEQIWCRQIRSSMVDVVDGWILWMRIRVKFHWMRMRDQFGGWRWGSSSADENHVQRMKRGIWRGMKKERRAGCLILINNPTSTSFWTKEVTWKSPPKKP